MVAETNKIIIAADLHLGLTSEQDLVALADEIRDRKPRLVVLAGDLGCGEEFETCLHIFKTSAEMVAVTAGNHDLWKPGGRSGVTSRLLFDRVLPDTTRKVGCHWLEDEPIILGTTAIVGSIGWYDLDARPEGASDADVLAAKQAWHNDARFMDRDWDDMAFADECRKRFMKHAVNLERNKRVKRIIAVTHVPVFPIQRRPMPDDLPLLDACFYHYALGDELLRITKLSDVISGHTHRGMDAVVMRDDMPSVRAQVVPADYGRPAFVEILA